MARKAPGRRLISGSSIVSGLIAGLVGAAVMAAYAMVAGATYLESGFFTPMYHIASVFIDPGSMMTSMERAAGGSDFFFRAGPALIGLTIHMIVGAAFGMIFALLATRLRMRGGAGLVAGVVYGLAVMVVMAFVGLPVAAALFGGGTPISDMAGMVGWPTFAVEHGLFGLVLGLWFVLGSERFVPAEREQRIGARARSAT